MASPEKRCSFTLDDYARPVLITAAYLLPIALIIHAITFWGHGIIDSEAMEFVLNYLQKRPFLAQIFDPQINDWGAYQARELSYVFDWIDARIFAALLDRGVLLFVPFSGAVGLIAVSAVYYWGARKVLGINRVMASLLLSLFLSCIVVQASTPILYRSSKIILSIALLAFLFYVFSLLQNEKRNVTRRVCVTLFLLGLLTALCDRQGFYYLISATFAMFMLWSIAKLRKTSPEHAYLRLACTNLAAIGTVIFYNRVFAPHLIHNLNGYWPNFFYQDLPSSQLLDPTLPGKAWQLFRQQVSFFFGNVPFFILMAIVAVAAVVFVRRFRAPIGQRVSTLVAITLISILALIALLAAMIARHPQLYSISDHAFWYYTLTVHAVILFGISVWVSFMASDNSARMAPFIYLTLIILIALNVRSYHQQQQMITAGTGWFAGQFAHSRALVDQFVTAPPNRQKLRSEANDLFLDDQAHFLENVERAYLHLKGESGSHPLSQP